MCRMDLDLLQYYIDRTIDPLEKIILEEHLRMCPDCRKELNRLKLIDWDLKSYFSQKEDVPVPEELAVLREASIRRFLKEEREGTFGKSENARGRLGFKEVLSLQVSNFNHSLMFINILVGLNREDKSLSKSPDKKKFVLKKILGM